LRIGIDVRYLSHGLLGGVHTYVYNLVSELARLESDNQFFLYADTKRSFELADLPANFTLRLLPWRSKFDSFRSDLMLKRLAGQDNLDVIHFPANYGFGPAGVPSLVTLHDALNITPLWESIKRDLNRPKRVALTCYLQLMTRLSARQTDCFLTVSRYAAKNIVEVSRAKIKPNKIKVIYSAAAEDFRPVTDPARLTEVRYRLGLKEHFVLADGLKNPGVILRAWEKLPAQTRAETQLVFFSRRPDLLPVALEAIKAGQVHHLLRPSQDDLIATYSMAELFLFPSWVEGFGLPILEAMACGAPVIASDRGSIPEIGSEAALYHDAEDAACLAHYLTDLLSSHPKREDLRRKGFERAAQFSWQKAAHELLDLYEWMVDPTVASPLATLSKQGA
jgi:glycosyltransferase involved in cell wall biosynthesis